MATVEAVMEERIARLESNVEHIQGDIGEIKVDLRALRDKMDTMYTGLSGRIDNLGTTLDGKHESLNDRIASIRLWALLLYGALAATLLSTMARGFGWI
jgi:hypothetical protein